ncbi:MAG: flotillin family protein [Spirochaetes bacterium]|nr:flotillin family protein [Spirochaetota bacterium]
MNYLLIAILAGTFFFFVLIMFLASRYKRCASNQILAIFGKVGSGKSVRCYHGGGAFVWPLIQDSAFLDLTPMTISIPLKGALSQQNIRINVPSTFTIAIDTTPESMNNAAVRLLNLLQKDIETMATEIIFGQLRLTVASLTIEDINQDREKFLLAIRNNIEAELRKIGLTLINVNITDITDESGYIESIGKKAASSAINQAKVDVAENTRNGEVGAAMAEKEQRIQIAKYDAEAVKGENSAKADISIYNADLEEKSAEANRRGEVARQNSEAEIQKAKAIAELKRLEAEEIVQKEIDKRKIEISASAEAARIREIANGNADALLAQKNAEAEGIKKILDAKSKGYRELVAASGNQAKDAATLLLVEKLEEIVKLQTEAIKNIKIDKITVWDSGNGEKGSTANFLSGMIKSLPALHDVAEMAGIDLPDYLGKTTAEGEVKKKVPEKIKNKPE